MRNLESSDWFTGPNLTSVVAVPAEGEQAQSFKMTVNASSPNDEVNSTTDAKNTAPSNTKESGGK
jgi:type IV pilus assembly protein PilN